MTLAEKRAVDRVRLMWPDGTENVTDEYLLRTDGEIIGHFMAHEAAALERAAVLVELQPRILTALAAEIRKLKDQDNAGPAPWAEVEEWAKGEGRSLYHRGEKR